MTVSQANHLQNRNGSYYFRRVVPLSCRLSIRRAEVNWSLKTKDRDIAIKRLPDMMLKFEQLLGLTSVEAGPEVKTYDSIRAASQALGFKYEKFDPATATTEAAVEFLTTRLQAIRDIKYPTATQIAAATGSFEHKLLIGDMIKRYHNLTRDSWIHLSERDRQKKLIPVDSAGVEFAALMKDPDLLTFSKADAYKFREFLIAKIVSGEIKTDTANKRLNHIRKVISKVFEVDHPLLANPFEKVSIADPAPAGKRPAFTEDEVQKLKATMEASDCNDELKAIIYIGMHTGATCKEIALINPTTDVFLNAEIPYMHIGPNDSRVKVKSGGARHRDVPLVEEALTWMAKHPNGFPRYRRDNGGEAVSAAANKLIARVCDKTFYSFRHRIADLLRNAGVNDSLKDAIMGHSTPGMGSHYGTGYTLAVKRQALNRAFGLTDD